MSSADRVKSDEELVTHLRDRARFLREETIRLIEIAKVGHYASSFSCVEILATLYHGHMRLKEHDPQWPERDRFLFGKGHAAVALYPLLVEKGFLAQEVLDSYTRLGNPLGDHPDMRSVPGVDFSSGSLGHALSAGLGMALGGRLQNLAFNVYVLLGDGELHEGQVWEAALGAAHHGVGNLVAIVDRNEYCLDGRVDDVIGIEPLVNKWEAFGWEAYEVDGHDVQALLDVLRLASTEPREAPAVIIAHTVKGKGISYMERELGWHLGYLVPEDQQDALVELRDGS